MKPDTTLTRRELLGATGTATAAVTAGLTTRTGSVLEAVWLDTPDLSTFARANFTRLGNLSAHTQATSHSGDRIAVHVPYGEGDREAVEDWVDADGDRETIRFNDQLETATLIVPAGDVVGSLLSGADLADASWVAGEIDVRQRVSLPEPVDTLQSEVGIDLPFGDRMALMFRDVDVFDHDDGVAFDDPPEGTVSDARDVTGAPDDLVDGARADIADLTVAVVDTGFNVAGGGGLLGETTLLDASWNVIDDETVGDEGDDAVADGNGHGTHVASTIVADPGDGDMDEYTGYLPGADLLVLKALDDDGGGTTDDIAAAVTYAADEGADLLCLSLGSPVWSVELERALAYAAGEDVTTFVAAGNDRTGTTWVNTPADAGYAHAVAAGTIDDPEDVEIAYFSNVGPDPGTGNLSNGATAGASPLIAAPGMELEALVADTSGSTEELALSGTSMACPCAVGAAGLILAEADVEQDHDELGEFMADHAARLEKAAVNEAGAGYPDVEAAIDEDEPEESQADARERGAEDRDDLYERLSDAQGGFLARLF